MRKFFFGTSCLLVLALVLQFYFAAVGVFSMPEDELFDIHAMNGRVVLPALVIINIIAAALAHAGKRTVWLTVLVLGLLIFQTLLFIITGLLTGSTPPPDPKINTAGTIMLSFHAVNGLAILGLSLVVARRAHRFLSAPPARRVDEESSVPVAPLVDVRTTSTESVVADQRATESSFADQTATPTSSS